MKKQEMLELKRFQFRMTAITILFIGQIALAGLFFVSAYIMFNRNFVGGFIIMLLTGVSATIIGYKNLKLLIEVRKKIE